MLRFSSGGQLISDTLISFSHFISVNYDLTAQEFTVKDYC